MKKSIVLAFVVSLGMAGLATAAGTWDFNADFSAASNPNGDWTYGMIPDFTAITPGYSMTTLDTSMAVGDAVNNWWTMANAAYLIPCVYHNYGVAPDLYANPVGMTALHPGPLPGGTANDVSYAAVVRWTAPADCPAIAIDGTFFAGNVGATSNLVVLNGGSAAGSALIEDYVTVADTPISQVVNGISAGDTIDFIVGTAGEFPNDTTPLEAVIVCIPEPISMLLLGLGSVALLRRRK